MVRLEIQKEYGRREVEMREKYMREKEMMREETNVKYNLLW